MPTFFLPDIDECINYERECKKAPEAMDFHLHERFEIYFFIRGDVNYLIEKKVYPLSYGDLFIMNNHEIHKASFTSDREYERITIHFDPHLIEPFNIPGFNLLECFVNRQKGENNKFNLDKSQIDGVYSKLMSIETINSDKLPGSRLLMLTAFIDLLVYLNRIFISTDNNTAKSIIPDILVPVLDYIENNLENELTLDILANEFYIDRFYLCRLFKKSIGSTLHQYIIYKRISEAKKLLSDGMNVTEACIKCGFSNYNNFLKRFKMTTGISPGRYRSQKIF